MDFDSGNPVIIPPLKVQIKEGVEPVMARSRRYPPLDRYLLAQHISSLEEHSLMYWNPVSRWGSAPRILAKKNVGSYRMTADLRAVNALTIPMASPMAHFEVLIASLNELRCYFSLECFRFYWQLLLHESTRVYFTVVTPEGLYTGNRVIMGSTDAVAFAQQVAESIIKTLPQPGCLSMAGRNS